MQDKSIIEGNTAIAFFMGGTKSKIDGKGKWIRFPEKHAGTDSFAFWPKNLKYHTSWDWIMPVVAKMEQIGYAFTTDPHTLEIIEYLSGKEETILHYDIDRELTKIQNWNYVVVDFITWYNTLSKDTNQSS